MPKCKRARHAKRESCVKTVIPPSGSVAQTSLALDEDVLAALAVHVFTESIQIKCCIVGYGTPPSTSKHAMMYLDEHVKAVALVSKTWNRAFKAWLPQGVEGALATALAIGIQDGLKLCNYTPYTQNVMQKARNIPYFPVQAWLPRESQVEWNIFLYSKCMATLTLMRRQVSPDNRDEHELKVCYRARRAPRYVLATMQKCPMECVHKIPIPNASWTFEGVDGMWRATAKGRPAAEVWQQEKAVLLEKWLLQKHAEITHDFRINTQQRVYYWC